MKSLFSQVRQLHGAFARVVSHLQSPFLLVVRLYWGWQFAQSGWGKLHRLAGVAHYFASLGLPFPRFTAAFVSVVELAGGILLAAGLFSRVTGLVLAIDMTVAYVTADRAALFAFLSDPGKFYNADPYTFLFASLLVLIFGAGKISLDALFGLDPKA